MLTSTVNQKRRKEISVLTPKNPAAKEVYVARQIQTTVASKLIAVKSIAQI